MNGRTKVCGQCAPVCEICHKARARTGKKTCYGCDLRHGAAADDGDEIVWRRNHHGIFVQAIGGQG